MKKISRRSVIAGLLTPWAIPYWKAAYAAGDFHSFKIMTEDYPPYNFNDNGVLQGISVDIMAEMFNRLQSGHKRSSIELLPWARGYNLTLQSTDHALFSTTRTENRENIFKWVGPFVPTTVGLTALKSRNLNITSLEDLHKLRIGVVKDDVGQLLLQANGFPESHMDVVLSNEQNYHKLMAKRVDAIAYETEVTKWGLKQLRAEPSDFEVIYILKRSDLYLALNKNTPDVIVKRLQQVFDSIVADGTHKDILAKYTGSSKI